MRIRARSALALGFFTLAACGGDDGGGGPDAARPDAEVPDAPPRPLCFDKVDAMCGYAPEPVTPADIPLTAQQALAERFNPAMVYTGAAIWAVSFDMLLVEGAPLLRAEHTGRVNFSYRVDEATTEPVFATPPADLRTVNLTTLPTTAPSGRGYVYFLDFPGTNLGNEHDQESWSAAWTTIQGDDPAAAPYPPLQYAHLFWLSRAERLLAIQYFFYYPYDKFTNNHEGDWEHVNVVLRYPEAGEPTLAMAHFSYHGRQTGVPAEALYRIGDGAGGDHVVVFVGGDACLNYVGECWCGDVSGGSFPYPGRYWLSYWEDLAGSAERPGRAIHASDFAVKLLPRIEDVDFAADPSLSWYAMPFIAGEPTTAANHAAVISTNNHRAPVGPGPAHDEYDVGIEQLDANFDMATPRPFVVPAGWNLVHQPPPDTFKPLATNTNCAN